MQLNELIKDLKEALPSTDLPVVVSALRHDNLVWGKISQPGFYKEAKTIAGSQAQLWNPAVLALSALGSNVSLDSLRGLPLKPLEPELRQQAARAYEDVFRTSSPPASLEKAGLLALALRERRRLTDTWQGLREELQQNASGKNAIQPEVWQTPVACLYGLAPDPVDLLSALLPEDPGRADHQAFTLVMHAILSNPLSLDEKVSTILSILERTDPEGQLYWLDEIKTLGETELSEAISRTFLVNDPSLRQFNHEPDLPSDAKSLDQLLQVEPLDQVVTRQHLARFYQLAGQPGKALPLLEANQAALYRLQANLAFQAAQAINTQKDTNSALAASQKAYQLAPESTLARTKYASELLRNGQPEKAAELLAGAPEDPDVLLAQTHLAIYAGDLEAARQASLRLVRESHGLALGLTEAIDLSRSLLSLNLYDDAAEAAQHGLDQYPNNLDLLNTLSQALRASGRIRLAADAADLAVALAPNQINQHRLLASMLEETGDFDRAMQEHNQIIRQNRVPLTQDLLALAQTAVKAEQPEQAIAACQAVLEREPDCALAHARYGEAIALQGHLPIAVQRLEQATLLSPDLALPWITLAKVHAEAGDQRKAIETLRSAAHIAPESAEIQLALAQASLAQGSPSEALPALRRAATLAPQSPQITTQLVQTLYELGHLEEARLLLQNARYLWPTLPELALWQAKTLVGTGEYQAALPPLEIALRSQPQEIEPYLLLARTMLKLVEQQGFAVDLEKSRQALRHVLDIDPAHFEARLLIAETQSAMGALQDALDTYQELSEMDLAKDPNWSWRIHLGMGRTAMALNQMDIAIAVLQEAVQVRPDDIHIQQSLAEAYLAARLTDEAIVSARTALSMAPDDLANLGWYARLAVAMHDEGEAINALEHAISLAPDRADMKNQLGHIQIKINDQNSASKTLESVLNLDLADPTELRVTARMFLELKAPDKSAACMRKAINNAPESSADLWAELGYLQGQMKEVAAAEESIQNALKLRPSDPALHTLYGNILSSQNKIQAAHSSYEEALALLNAGLKSNPVQTMTPWEYIPEDCTPAALHYRISQMLHDLGDLRAALLHAEQAVSLNPWNLNARILASQTANSLLDFQYSQELTSLSFDAKAADQPSDPLNGDPNSALHLYALQAELALEKDDLQIAQAAINQAKVISSEDPRVLAGSARIFARQGDYQQAGDALEKAVNQLVGSIDESLTCGYPTLPLAEAALDLYQWDVALPLFQQVARSLPLDPLAQLSFARALVKAAEAQRILPELGIQRHAPGNEKLGEAAYQQFERAILAANRLSNSSLVARWHRRGQVAFHPCEKHLKGLQQVAQTPDDLSILFSAGAGAENAVPADLANQFSEHPTVLFQKCLGYLKSHPEEALPLAQTLVAGQPENTLYQALLAMVSEACGDIPVACQSIEAALSSWPDEPVWHALAGRVWNAVGDYPQALEHWKIALNLQPENASLAHSLGEAYTRSGQVDAAINTLNRATQLDPEQPEIWISLAKARRSAGDYPQAISSAEKAITLAPNQVEPMLLSGEIALAAGQTDLARNRAESALMIEPNHPSAVLLFSRIQAHTGQHTDALQTLEDALPMVAEPFELLLERARLVRKLQGLGVALHELTDLADQYPEEAQVHAEIALALVESGQSEAAEKAAQAALLLQPDQPDLHLLLGRIQRSTGQLDQALHHLAEAIRQKPHDLEAYLELGRAHQDRREFEKAQEILKQAADLAPLDPRPLYQAGVIAKEIKDYVTAERLLRKAASLAPDDVAIRRQLAAIIAINLVHSSQEASIQS